MNALTYLRVDATERRALGRVDRKADAAQDEHDRARSRRRAALAAQSGDRTSEGASSRPASSWRRKLSFSVNDYDAQELNDNGGCSIM